MSIPVSGIYWGISYNSSFIFCKLKRRLFFKLLPNPICLIITYGGLQVTLFVYLAKENPCFILCIVSLILSVNQLLLGSKVVFLM